MSVAYGILTGIPGIQPFVTSINMGLDQVTPGSPGYDQYRTNDCIHYIDKLASFGTNGQLVISASYGGYANTNYVLDDVRHGTGYGRPYNTNDLDYSGNGDKVWSATNGLLTAGVPQSAIIFSNELETCLASIDLNCVSRSDKHHVTENTNFTNLAGYMCWGAHSSLANEYPRNGAVVWGTNSSWWIISTVESFNGWRDIGQGNFTQWFSQKAFGGSAYEKTPIGAVSHTDEPGITGIEDASVYFGLWASGKRFAICAWMSRATTTPTPYFQAVGDPFVTR